jgi:hypothetical protein
MPEEGKEMLPIKSTRDYLPSLSLRQADKLIERISINFTGYIPSKVTCPYAQT